MYCQSYQRSMDAGMNDHITKPIDKKLLTRTLLQWIPATGVTPPTELADMGSVPILQVASTAPNAATPLIDLDAAAQRLGGNRAFFDQIAQAFRDDAAAQSEQALKAMNISAPEDQETAKRLWQVLGEQFALVLDELTAISLPVVIAVPTVATAAAAIHTQLRADMLRSLATMLGAGNMQACTLCGEIRQTCTPHLDARFVALEEAVSRLDFAKALAHRTDLLSTPVECDSLRDRSR